MEILTDDYLERFGRILINTYNIKVDEPKKLATLVQNTFNFLVMEQERDMREAANKAQWNEERIDIVGSNGNDGLHY